MRTIFRLLTVLALTIGLNSFGQGTNGSSPEFQALVDQIKAKIAAGQTSEAELKPELGQFDHLIAEQNGAKTDSAAHMLFMKAMLYVQVIGETDKGRQLIEEIKTNYPDTVIARNADQILTSLDRQAAAQKLQATLAVGLPFPDFAEKDLDGKSISVGALKGKVVLVDFWATWCGPCRGELPNVIATYRKHHAEGFEIIGVSLDSDREKLDAFLKQTDGMSWPQYFDGQGWNNKLAVKYGVDSIPFAVLIGPNGKIIGKSLRGEALEKEVAAALAKK
jgi:thiol-disulfide isomerase/thioredoxin